MPSYQVLARKWRPQNFQDMIGQEPILRMLVNALNQQRLHHAYLFSGTRGVGKTTLARIIAKCLNCEVAISATPCGTCPSCQAIDNGCFFDLLEVDGASRTKVEDTRDLLENVQYPPSQGRFKVYIIDEVHMLSGHSFNALLKTLEEPPAHVKFILATTEPKRLPITVLSRCLQFHLKPLSIATLTQHLQKICTEEKINAEPLALEQLAEAAHGSVRDSLSLLDQAIVYSNGALTHDGVQKMLGSVPQQDLTALLSALAERDGKKLISAITHLTEQATDFNHALAELITLLHKISLAQTVPDSIALTPAIQELVAQFSPEDIQLYYQIALIGRRDLPLAPSPELGFEMTLLRMLAFRPTSDIMPVANATSKGALSTPNRVPPSHVHSEKPAAVTTSMTTQAKGNDSATWQTILPKLQLTGMTLALASNCSLINISNNKVTLALSVSHKPMLSQKLIERLQQALTQHFNKPMTVNMQFTDDALQTPMKQHVQDKENRLNEATKAITNDNHVKQFIELFNASIIKETIQAT